MKKKLLAVLLGMTMMLSSMTTFAANSHTLGWDQCAYPAPHNSIEGFEEVVRHELTTNAGTYRHPEYTLVEGNWYGHPETYTIWNETGDICVYPGSRYGLILDTTEDFTHNFYGKSWSRNVGDEPLVPVYLSNSPTKTGVSILPVYKTITAPNGVVYELRHIKIMRDATGDLCGHPWYTYAWYCTPINTSGYARGIYYTMYYIDGGKYDGSQSMTEAQIIQWFNGAVGMY